MMAYVIYHNERFLIDAKDPEWPHIETFKWWLLPHGLAGACALILGPMQFSERIRQRFLRLHKTVGWIYVVSALITGPVGAYIQYFEERLGTTRSFSIATAVDATILFSTTALGLYFVLRGQIESHRQWMTRSYAIAIVFLQVRVVSGLGGWDGDEKATETIVWSCVALSLLVGDLVLQWQASRRARPARAAA